MENKNSTNQAHRGQIIKDLKDGIMLHAGGFYDLNDLEDEELNELRDEDQQNTLK